MAFRTISIVVMLRNKILFATPASDLVFETWMFSPAHFNHRILSGQDESRPLSLML